MEIQSTKTTPDTPPPPLIPPFISRAADRTEHFRLSFSISPHSSRGKEQDLSIGSSEI